MLFGLFFFFQAEDGIRDWSVTGVQTCALPICIVLRILNGSGFVKRLQVKQGAARWPKSAANGI